MKLLKGSNRKQKIDYDKLIDNLLIKIRRPPNSNLPMIYNLNLLLKFTIAHYSLFTENYCQIVDYTSTLGLNSSPFQPVLAKSISTFVISLPLANFLQNYSCKVRWYFRDYWKSSWGILPHNWPYFCQTTFCPNLKPFYFSVPLSLTKLKKSLTLFAEIRTW